MRAKNESELSEIYEEVLNVIDSVNASKAQVSLDSGSVSAPVLTNLTVAKNESLIISVEIENLTLNMTSGDPDLAGNLIEDLSQAQDLIQDFVNVIVKPFRDFLRPRRLIEPIFP